MMFFFIHPTFAPINLQLKKYRKICLFSVYDYLYASFYFMYLNLYVMSIDNKLSGTISFLRFPATLLVVIIHAYTASRGVYIPNSTFYDHFSYVFSLCMGDVAVPMFFAISGYLFFIKFSNKSQYVHKLERRVHTLLIPYLCWNAFMILFYWVLQSIPYLSPFFSGANQAISTYNFTDFLSAFWDCGHWFDGNGTPILQPYWYIRNLIILSILSPVIFYYLKRLKWIGVILPLVYWMFTPHLAFIGQSITFFSFGAIFSINNIDVEKQVIRRGSVFVIIYFLLLTFEYINHFYLPDLHISFLHRLTVLSGTCALFTLAYKYHQKIRIPRSWTESSFLIYTLHYPIMLGVRKLGIHLFPDASQLLTVLLYIGSIALTTAICVLLYKVLNNYLPGFLKFTTGKGF